MSRRAVTVQAIVVEEDDHTPSVYAQLDSGKGPEVVKFIEERQKNCEHLGQINELDDQMGRLKVAVGIDESDCHEKAMEYLSARMELVREARNWIRAKARGRKGRKPKVLEELDKWIKLVIFLKAHYGEDIPRDWYPVWNKETEMYQWSGKDDG